MIRKQDLQDGKIISIDNFFDSIQATEMWYHANKCEYKYGQSSDSRSSLIQRRMVHHFDPELFTNLDLWKQIKSILDSPIELVEAYLNYSESSTLTLPHCDNTDGGMSVLICVNQEWNRSWGGYTAFFKDMTSNKIIETICPEPRKAVFFTGATWHYALPIVNFSPYARFMLAIKTTYVKKEKEQI